MIILQVDPQSIGRKIRDRRLQFNISRNDLAERSGISASYIGEIESGKHTNPSLAVLSLLSAELNCKFLIESGDY